MERIWTFFSAYMDTFRTIFRFLNVEELEALWETGWSAYIENWDRSTLLQTAHYWPSFQAQVFESPLFIPHLSNLPGPALFLINFLCKDSRKKSCEWTREVFSTPYGFSVAAATTLHQHRPLPFAVKQNRQISSGFAQAWQLNRLGHRVLTKFGTGKRNWW